MIKLLKNLGAELLGSKKFAALMVGLLATGLSYPLTRFAGMDEISALELSTALSGKVVLLVGAYLAGQGLADFGKEKAKLAPPAEPSA